MCINLPPKVSERALGFVLPGLTLAQSNRTVLDGRDSWGRSNLEFFLMSEALLACGFSVVGASRLADRILKLGHQREVKMSEVPEIWLGLVIHKGKYSDH